MSNELLFQQQQQQQQQQQANTNSQLEINQVGVGGGEELGEDKEGVVEMLQELEHEIECPRCNDVMVLSADFDSLLYYLCEECKFSLSL